MVRTVGHHTTMPNGEMFWPIYENGKVIAKVMDDGPHSESIARQIANQPECVIDRVSLPGADYFFYRTRDGQYVFNIYDVQTGSPVAQEVAYLIYWFDRSSPGILDGMHPFPRDGKTSVIGGTAITSITIKRDTDWESETKNAIDRLNSAVFEESLK